MVWELHRLDVIASAAFKRLGQKELRGQSTAHAQMVAARHAPSSLTHTDDMQKRNIPMSKIILTINTYI